MRYDVTTADDVAVTERKFKAAGKLEAVSGRDRLAAALPRVHSAAELYNGAIQELRPLVDGLLYDGLTMLVAKPKDGKSWLALQLSVAIAGGRAIDGITPRETGLVLFVALEEPAARTANRLRKLAPPGPWLDGLTFVYELLPLMGGGAEQLAELIRQHTPRFVVVDTLTALVRAAKRETDVFRGQYEEINRLRQICADARICCLLIHHTRKGISDGPVEAVAGTGGIAAAVDAIWHLRRRPGNDATLDVLGREVEERSFALHFERETPFGWRFVGDGQEAVLSAEREEILELLQHEAPLTPAKIALMLRKNANTIRSLVHRLHKDGHISRNSKGGYSLSSSSRYIDHSPNTVNSVNASERTNEE